MRLSDIKTDYVLFLFKIYLKSKIYKFVLNSNNFCSLDINKKENSKFVTHVLTELLETEIFVIYIRRVFAIYVKEK